MPTPSSSRTQDFHRRLGAARARAELTYRDLGERAGIGHGRVSDLEHGNGMPGIDTLERLADALKVSPCWLAFGIGRGPDLPEE